MITRLNYIIYNYTRARRMVPLTPSLTSMWSTGQYYSEFCDSAGRYEQPKKEPTHSSQPLTPHIPYCLRAWMIALDPMRRTLIPYKNNTMSEVVKGLKRRVLKIGFLCVFVLVLGRVVAYMACPALPHFT